MSKYTKQAEFEFKLRIYLKYLDFSKYFYQYVNELINEIHNNLSTSEIQNNLLIDELNSLNRINNNSHVLNRCGYIGENKIYTKEENIDEFINNLLIQNIDSETINKLLKHLEFINDKYIILENLQN